MAGGWGAERSRISNWNFLYPTFHPAHSFQSPPSLYLYLYLYLFWCLL